MNLPRKLPIGIQSFKDLREKKFLYVDKTEYLSQLVNNGKAYFLSLSVSGKRKEDCAHWKFF